MPENQSYAEQNKARLKEITDSIESNIKDLFQSDKYQQYLRTVSRFHKYSVNNTMLIYMQKPDATLVAGFNKWKDQFERNVMKGERGIKIIAPTPFKKKIEQEKLDPDTKQPMLDADGNVIIEEKTVQIPMYKVVSVFDVSQTDGKPLPTLATDLAGNVQNFDVFMEALKRSAPVPIAFEAMQHDMDGYFSGGDQRIAIREGMSEVQTVSATVHEIAHSKLHNKDLPEVKEQWKLVMVSDGGTKKDFTGGFDTRAEAEAAGEEKGWQHTDENEFAWRLEVEEDTSIAEFVKKSRNTEEVEAESVSFAVCAYYGIATGENSFGYIAGWSQGKELSELRSSLETINKTASGLITDIDRNYAIVMKERGLDKAEPEQTAELPDEPYVEYKLHANPRSTGEKDAAFIQAYEHKGGELYPADIIGFGAYDALRPLVNKLNDEKHAQEDAKKALDEAIQLDPSGHLDFDADAMNFLGTGYVSVMEYLEEHPPVENPVFEILPIDADKTDWLYSDSERDKERGVIGHLRGDFGSGKEFWTTWWPHNDDKLNTQPFKTELDAVVNWLRQDFGPLSSLRSMEGFCKLREDKAKVTASLPAYGFQIETPNHQYFLRCNPTPRDYNFYLYCTDKQAQREYARETPKHERPSVLAQLKTKTPEKPHNKKAPVKGAEMEM